MARRHWFLWGMAGGLAVRLVALWQSATVGLPIADERHYAELATSLLQGRGFAWETGALTSLRPPLYPALVATIWWLAGEGNLVAVRCAQIVLSLATAGVAYALGRRAFDERTGAVAAAIVWLYPPLTYLNFTILTETLFTLLLTGFVLLAVALVQQSRPTTALACGVVLGLGALTRSVLWPLPLVLCPLLVLLIGGALRQRVALAALVLAGYAVVVTPWAVRNTRLQGVTTIVDTMGGMNLRMGNYEHTPEDRIWDAVSLTGEKSWVYELTQEDRRAEPPLTEGRKDRWAQRKAFEYMLANPGTTLRRAAIKFSDLWGLERSYPAAVRQGLYRPPRWLGLTLSALMVLSSAAFLLAAAAAVWLGRPAWRTHLLLLFPIAAVTAAHAIAFGHPRYHLPLVPLLAVFVAALASRGGLRSSWSDRPAVYGAAALVLLLVALWIRQIVVVDGDRIRALFGGMW